MIKTGLLFGSFNPVHIGHLMIANYFYSFTDLDELWLVVTPQNPWKKKQDLIPDQHRLEMVKLAIKNSVWLQATQFEKELTPPYYTYQSLDVLRKQHPDRQFVLLIGGDNYLRFKEWKNAEEILEHHEVWAFPRHKHADAVDQSQIKLFKAPKFEISGEMIREGIREKKDMTYFLPPGVYDYILTHQLL